MPTMQAAANDAMSIIISFMLFTSDGLHVILGAGAVGSSCSLLLSGEVIEDNICDETRKDLKYQLCKEFLRFLVGLLS